jgi:hypothetical protein
LRRLAKIVAELPLCPAAEFGACARRRLRPAALFAVLVLAGCGLVVGGAPTGVQLLVTQEFGSSVVDRSGALKVSGGETVMSLLMGHDTVSVAAGGHIVQGIDGLTGSQEAGRPVNWFYYINGVEAPKGATATSVHPGDHVWWDLHDWSQAAEIPAVVGSFPEPFLNGIEGKRLPVRVECAAVSAMACRTVTVRLRAYDVPAAVAAIGSGGAAETLRMMVGPWAYLAGDLEAQSIARGPRASGVYARFSTNGTALTLLDRDGRPAQTLLAGAGLIAATRLAEEAPVWVITGTDGAGVERAARALNQATLADRFAVALASSGAIALPEPAR